MYEKEKDKLIKYIYKKYPPKIFKYIADVGGGNGDIAKKLIKKGYHVTIIDPKGKKISGGLLIKDKFLIKDSLNFDLLIGFLPCGGTKKLIRAGKYKPVVFTPCKCKKHWNIGKNSQKDVRDEMKKYAKKHNINMICKKDYCEIK